MQTETGLNLGCGPLLFRTIDGIKFLNIDNDSRYIEYAQKEGKDVSFVLYDLRKGLPMELIQQLDSQPVFINLSQFLEHLNLPSAERVLKGCYDCLVNASDYYNEPRRGVIRISIPDTELLLFHLKTNMMNKFEDSQPSQYYNSYNSQMMKFSLLLFGSLTEDETVYYGHQMCYDFNSLKELVERFGFTNVRRVNFDERFDAAVAQDHQLAIEATKM